MQLRDGFRLGENVAVYPLESRIVVDGDERRVTPRIVDVLLRLAEADGDVVERETLLADVWGERAVSDEPLTRCIADLRKALGDARSNPTFVATIPKRGYRLLAAVAPLGEDATVTPTEPQPLRQRLGMLRKLAAGFALLVLAAVVQIVIERAIESDDAGEPATRTTAAVATSIAVLPFVDNSPSQDQAWLGDGLADELTSALAADGRLSVTSRTAAFRFRSSELPPGEIAATLGVAHLVEGSVSRSDGRVRVEARLIDPTTGFSVWSTRLDEAVGDIALVKGRLAVQLGAFLAVGIAPDDGAPANADAYQLYLRARYLAQQGNQPAFEEAVERLRGAVAIDPTFAVAWAQLADVYNNLAGQGFWDWDRGFEAAREAAREAVTADPDMAAGHAQLAWVAHRYDGDLHAAFDHMQQALSHNAFDTEILPGAAVLLLQAGRLDQAIDVLDYCVRRSPTDTRLRYNLGVAYKYADRLDEAEATFRRVREMNPDYNGGQYQLAETLLLNGDASSALAEFEALGGYNQLKGRAVANFALGDVAASDAALAELTREWSEKWPGVIADVYAYRGELDAAFEWLERDFDKYGAAGWGEVRLQRWYDNLREDPRWQGFLSRVGFTEADVAGLELALDFPAG